MAEKLTVEKHNRQAIRLEHPEGKKYLKFACMDSFTV